MLGFLIIYVFILSIVSILVFLIDVLKWSIKKNKIVVVPSSSHMEVNEDD